jgi:hypothetical protein
VCDLYGLSKTGNPVFIGHPVNSVGCPVKKKPQSGMFGETSLRKDAGYRVVAQ